MRRIPSGAFVRACRLPSYAGTLDSITEALRGGNIAAAAADMDKAKREYDVTLSAIRACMEN